MPPLPTLLAVLFADGVSINPEDAITSGAVGTAAIGCIWWLIRDNKATIKELVEVHQKTIHEKDALLTALGGNIISLGERFDQTIKSVVDKFENALKEMRTENRIRDDRHMELSGKMVGAVEHVTVGLGELKNQVQGVQAAVAKNSDEIKQLSGRVDGLASAGGSPKGRGDRE